jgi:hypothetical protein
MQDDLRRISDALGVPLAWLIGVAVTGMAALLAAVASHDAAVGDVAAAFGGVIALIGIRGALRPSRRFRLENVTNSPGIDTTRRVGLFYVAVGLIWAMIALLATKSS